MRCVKQYFCIDSIVACTDFSHVVREQAQTATDGDQIRSGPCGQRLQTIQIYAVAIAIHLSIVVVQTIKAGPAASVMRDIFVNRYRWKDDCVSGGGQDHKPVKVGYGARKHLGLSRAGVKNLSAE